MLAKLQPSFCHRIDSALAVQIPVLTENDWFAAKKWNEFRSDFIGKDGHRKPDEVLRPLILVRDGPLEVFVRHGIFSLVDFLHDTELLMVYVLLCLESNHCVSQTYFAETMRISKAYVSTILKTLLKWKLVEPHRPIHAKGRARGRKRMYQFRDDVRKRLDKDLSEYDFFRSDVVKRCRTIALSFAGYPWRKDLDLLGGWKEPPPDDEA